MESNSTSFISTAPVDHFIKLFETIGIIADPYVSPIEATLKSSLNSLFPSLTENVSELLDKIQSPLSKRLPLMNPFHVLLIVIAYLSTIHFGKAFMSNREKLNVKYLSIFHNFFLVSLSAYMFGTVSYEAWRNGYSLFGNPEVKSEDGWQVKYVNFLYAVKIS